MERSAKIFTPLFECSIYALGISNSLYQKDRNIIYVSAYTREDKN